MITWGIISVSGLESEQRMNTTNLYQVSAKWMIPDVLEVAPDLTEAECITVLNRAVKHHDATIGINWDVLRAWADDVRSERNA